MLEPAQVHACRESRAAGAQKQHTQAAGRTNKLFHKLFRIEDELPSTQTRIAR